MAKKILLFAAAGLLAAQQPSIRLEPAVITSCQEGAGQATVFWDAQGVAPVTIFVAETPMSGPELTTGTALTGQWAAEGVVVSVRDAGDRTLASVRAVVKCDGRGWWPLEIGNEWHFRLASRAVTGAHAVWRVARKERIDGVEWSVMNPGPWTPYTPVG